MITLPSLSHSRQTIRQIIARAGKIVKIPFPVHPHQLRHACGYPERRPRS